MNESRRAFGIPAARKGPGRDQWAIAGPGPAVKEGDIAMKVLKALFGFALVLPLLAFSASPALAAEKLKTLRFGLLPAEEGLEMIRQFQGIADHVSGAVGLPNKIFVSQSYNALIEAMEAGKIDIAYLGGGTYVAAYLKGMDVVPLVVAKLRGRTYYKSCIITNAKSKIQTLNDLKGKKFAFVTPTSTSGGVGPRYYLNKNGINPEKDFADILYAGKHDSVYLAVKNNKVDAGAVGDVYFPRWKERGILKYSKWDEPNDKIDSPDIRIVGCQKVPGTPMVARGELGKKMLKKLQKAFTSLPFNAVDKLRFWGPTEKFVPTNHAFYEDLPAALNGINPEKDFADILYAGKHDSVYLAVKNNKVDAGAVGDVYFPRWKERGILKYSKWDEPNDKIDSPDIRIVGCQKVPGTPMVARGELGKKMLKKLQKAFTSLPFNAVDKLRFWGPTEKFVPTNHAFYEDLLAMKKLAAELKKKKK